MLVCLRAMASRAGPRRRRPQPWRSKLPLRLLSFRSFALFLLLLSLLALLPSLPFHLRLQRGLRQKCRWLQNRPLVCAHGGDTSRAPPNTLEAYNLALESNVDCIEIDASRTHDGVLVALHDRDLQNIYSNDFVRVGDLTIDEVIKLDAGYNYPKEFQNQIVPTLRYALQHVSKSLKQVIIDAKIGPPKFEFSLAADILLVVNDTQCKNCLIWSKVDSLVEELKMLSPKVMAGYIVMKDPVTGRANDVVRMDGVEVVGAYYGLVNAKLVDDVHKAGKKLHVWTVNDREAMETMLSEGVDCIVTSYPYLLQRVMLETEEQCIQEGYSL